MARALDHWLRSYLEYTRNLEAPSAFHFWSGVATIAGALQGKTWIDMGFFKWKPNFFIIFVAPAGVVNKSTSIRVGTRLLNHVDNVKLGPKSLTWQYITDALADSSQEFSDEEGNIIKTSSLHCEASELGTFLDPSNSYMIDMLVDLWDGQDVPWSRGTRGEGKIEVPNPWINFVGATTPSWIANNFPEYAIGGGFVSRTVFVYAESKRHLVAYPKYEQEEADPELEQALIHDLQEIGKMTGEFVLTNDAIEWGREWYHELWKNRPSHLNNERMAGYVARKQTHVHKLAMVLSAAQRDTQMIHKEDLQNANDFMGAIEKTMNQVFSQVSDNTYARYAANVLRVLQRHGELSKKALWQELFHVMAWSDFEQAYQSCLNAGYVTAKQKGGDLILTLNKEEEDGDKNAQVPSGF